MGRKGEGVYALLWEGNFPFLLFFDIAFFSRFSAFLSTNKTTV
jgi:hypothetical protein